MSASLCQPAEHITRLLQYTTEETRDNVDTVANLL